MSEGSYSFSPNTPPQTKPVSMPKTIFINGRFLTRPVTGVQRYSLELIGEIDRQMGETPVPGDFHFVCLVPPEPIQHPGWRNVEIRRAGFNRGELWEQIDLPLHAGHDLLFSPANIGPWHYRNQVVTFHDASVFAVPRSYSPLFRAKYRFVFRQLAGRARAILTDTQFSRQELARYLDSDPARFTVIAPGCDHLDRVQADIRTLERHGLQKDAYLLLVGGQASHKNLANVFTALQGLQTCPRIIVVGAAGGRAFRKQRTHRLPAQGEVLGYVDDMQLKALYENALGLIFPSVYEGFGLPVLEAMRCGCPVLSSSSAALAEVAGRAALFFDPLDPQEISAALHSFLSSPTLREELRLKGQKRAAAFTWARAASQLLDLLRQV